MTFYENILTVGILLAILLIGYLKVSNKTLVEFVKEIKEIFSSPDVNDIEGGLIKQ